MAVCTPIAHRALEQDDAVGLGLRARALEAVSILAFLVIPKFIPISTQKRPSIVQREGLIERLYIALWGDADGL